MRRFFILLVSIVMAMNVAAQSHQEPLRVGVAGVTHGHLWNIIGSMNRGDYEIVGVAEQNDEYRNNNGLVGRIPADKFYASLEEMLDKEKPQVVCAYGSILDHEAVVEACAPRGISVMVEKPLATTYKAAKHIQALAEKYGINVMTNYETTWYPANHEVKRIIDSGELGSVRKIEVYDGHQGPKEIGCGDMFLEWLTDPVGNGGGAVIDFGCYGVNLATWIMGGQRPKSVYAVLHQNKPDIYPKVDDDATIILDYGTCTIQVMGSWCWPMNRKDMYVYMDHGYVYQKNASDMEIYQSDKKNDVRIPDMPAPYNDQYRYLKALYWNDLQGTEQNTVDPCSTDLNSLSNNVIVCQILEAARKSAKTGKVVKL